MSHPEQIKEYFLYSLFGLMGFGLAAIVSLSLIRPSQSQEELPVPPPAGSEQPPADPVAEGATEEASQSAPSPQVSGLTFLEPYYYDPREDRRDPFSAVNNQPTENVTGPAAGPLLPLQRFRLDDLKLTGVIWNVNSPKAMFTDPNNTIHMVGVDERIGRNNGYIAVIREGEVVVVETARRRGELTYTTRVLRIER